jgi:peptidoglycan hydrolase-like protein with peptidoglycan-binding domain
MKRYAVFVIFCCVLFSAACSFVKASGTMTRRTGEVMNEMGSEREGTFLGKMLHFGGNINAAVGKTVENIADNKDESKPKSQQFIEANKAVHNAAVDSVKSSDDKAEINMSKAQELLKAAGYDPGPIDGRCGGNTKQAIMKYQKDNNLKVTGVLDESTRQSLGMK